MNIAYIIYPAAVINGKSNGVRSQALIWKRGLEELGNKVVLINLWDNYEWQLFDVIHIFGKGLWLEEFIPYLKKHNPNIYISPIIDSTKSHPAYRIATFLGIQRLRIFSPTYVLKKQLSNVKGVFVRTNYEREYLTKAFGFNEEKVFNVSLPYSIDIDLGQLNLKKEPFCLHVSSIYQDRKNVIRLIEAAKRFNFKLVLAGSTGTEKEFEPIKRAIDESENIKVLGFISDQELLDLYRRAKVFALPSTYEGVGMVALDAAVAGCQIVLTDVGGPKEYYNGLATTVDPYDIDAIGSAIIQSMESNEDQPMDLRNYVINEYSIRSISSKIIGAYEMGQ